MDKAERDLEAEREAGVTKERELEGEEELQTDSGTE